MSINTNVVVVSGRLTHDPKLYEPRAAKVKARTSTRSFASRSTGATSWSRSTTT